MSKVFDAPPSLRGRPTHFAGHQRELTHLDSLLDQAFAGHGRVAFVTGEAGRGKTALLRHFGRLAQARHSSLVVAGGQCSAVGGQGDLYLPFREVLAALTGGIEALCTTAEADAHQVQRLRHCTRFTSHALSAVGPDLADAFLTGSAKQIGHRTSLDSRMDRSPKQPDHQEPTSARESAQHALFEQYTKVLQQLAGRFPLLLTLDDLQWADSGTIALLFHLGRRLDGYPILLLGAYRESELRSPSGTARHPLTAVVNEFGRLYGSIYVNLSEADGQAFVDALLDSEPNRLGSEFREALYRRTCGHPLFTTEILRSMQERGDLRKDADDRWVANSALNWEVLPARIERVIAERIDRLPHHLRETLKAASVLGEIFAAEVVAEMQNIDCALMVRRLSGSLGRRRRLLRSHGTRRLGNRQLSEYRFRYVLIQKYICASLDDSERRYLHRAAHNALETLIGGRSGIPDAHLVVPKRAHKS